MDIEGLDFADTFKEQNWCNKIKSMSQHKTTFESSI